MRGSKELRGIGRTVSGNPLVSMVHVCVLSISLWLACKPTSVTNALAFRSCDLAKGNSLHDTVTTQIDSQGTWGDHELYSGSTCDSVSWGRETERIHTKRHNHGFTSNCLNVLMLFRFPDVLDDKPTLM